ncbi:hypothetical protein [Rossellomorea marisflavi]|uniref:hypothetical protein n=1 Tax=Rossellomorea marisflavi TaxID=189381 RepID=UPI00345C83E0
MIDLFVQLKQLIKDDPMFIGVEVCSLNGTTVHCTPEYMYGQTDLKVKRQAFCTDRYRISRNVKGIEFFTFVTDEELRGEFPHLLEEVSA